MGNASHAEGVHAISPGVGSHAEGGHSHAKGEYSHAEGWAGVARYAGGHASGALGPTLTDTSYGLPFDQEMAYPNPADDFRSGTERYVRLIETSNATPKDLPQASGVMRVYAPTQDYDIIFGTSVAQVPLGEWTSGDIRLPTGSLTYTEPVFPAGRVAWLSFRIMVVAKETTTDGAVGGKVWHVRGAMKWDGTTATLVGSPTIDTFSDGATWTISISATSRGPVVVCTGGASAKIRWVAEFETVLSVQPLRKV